MLQALLCAKTVEPKEQDLIKKNLAKQDQILANQQEQLASQQEQLVKMDIMIEKMKAFNISVFAFLKKN